MSRTYLEVAFKWMKASKRLNNTDVHHDEHYFNNFEKNKYPYVFMPIAVTCIFLGIVGNLCSCFIFGNTKTRIFATRDALYFRRFSIVDFLVCLVVLPYAICYEAEIVKINAVCKTMEYIRHVIIYSSHLLLAAYSFEIPRRTSYAKVHANLRKTLFVIIILSCVFSFPSILVFGVPNKDTEEHSSRVIAHHISVPVNNSKKVYQEPSSNFCHMISTVQKEGKHYDSMKLLRVHYYTLFCLAYIMVMILFLFKVLHYFDNTSSHGRKSISVQVREHGSLQKCSKHDIGRWQHRVLRHSQTGHQVILAEYFDPYIDTRNDSIDSISNDNRTLETLMKSDPSKPHFHAGRVRDSISLTNSQIDGNIDNSSEFHAGPSVLTNIDNIERETVVYNLEKQTSTSDTSITEVGNFNQVSLDSTRPSRVRVFKRSSSEIRYYPSFPVRRHFFPLSRKKRQLKPILKHSTSEPGLSISSFKRTIMILIALDLICIPVAITFYFLYDESAIYLNLIHIKSVFSMYFVILSRKTLLKLIFKKICPFWPGTDTSNIFEIHRQETLAQLNKFRQT